VFSADELGRGGPPRGHDPAYIDGFYEQSSAVRRRLKRHARLSALHVLSNDFWTHEHWRALGFSSAEDFTTDFLGGYFDPMDASDLVTQSWTWQHSDVRRHIGASSPQPWAASPPAPRSCRSAPTSSSPSPTTPPNSTDHQHSALADARS